MYIRCGTFVCVYREIEFIWTDNVVSREIWSIFKQHSYIRDRRLSLRIHKGDVQPNDSTVASVIESNLSFFFFFFFACPYRIERKRERRKYSLLIRLWLILRTTATYLFSSSDLYLVESIAWTPADVILSFFAWMHIFLVFFFFCQWRKKKEDQVNQQCERYWLKHHHFLYCVCR
jgi:hypothetical protein